MIECWLMVDTPEADGAYEVGLIGQSPDEILHYMDQATNRQRSGLYAPAIGNALAIQATVLSKAFPQFTDEGATPDPIGFGIEDDTAQIRIRSVGLRPGEADPCVTQGQL